MRRWTLFATFDLPGTYLLQLTANDSRQSATNYMTVFVDDGSVAQPIVSFITPTNGETVLPGIIPLVAAASATTGTVAQVEFSVNGALMGRAINAPYTVNWLNPPLGNYTLSAVATDAAGRVSPPVYVNVTVDYGVCAGPDLIITNHTTNIATNSLPLQGVVFGDTGYATNSPYTVSWYVQTWPPNADEPIFSNAGVTNPVVTFAGNSSSLGTYVLTLGLTSDNGLLYSSTNVTITLVSDDVLPYQATNYFYLYAAADYLTNFQATNFDDSAWSHGPAGFGNSFGCYLPAATDWPGLTGNPPGFTSAATSMCRREPPT